MEGVAVLAYSAHPGAVEHLRRIADAVAALDQVQGVYAVHRTGQLRVGDLAVVCAVAALSSSISRRAPSNASARCS